MVQTYIIRNITENKQIVTDVISGKILKVVFKCNKPTNARIRIITNEYEEVINHLLENKFVILYPYNKITEFYIDNPRTDYYYSNDKLGIDVKCLNNGDVIDFIKIFYE